MSELGENLTKKSLKIGRVDPEKVAVGTGKVAFCGGDDWITCGELWATVKVWKSVERCSKGVVV